MDTREVTALTAPLSERIEPIEPGPIGTRGVSPVDAP